MSPRWWKRGTAGFGYYGRVIGSWVSTKEGGERGRGRCCKWGKEIDELSAAYDSSRGDKNQKRGMKAGGKGIIRQEIVRRTSSVCREGKKEAQEGGRALVKDQYAQRTFGNARALNQENKGC